MFVVSSGMPKSGSAYIYNILNDVLVAAGNADAREVKRKYRLDWLMKWHNNNVGHPFLLKLLFIWLISLKERPFVVKTHSGPTGFLRLLILLGIVKLIYIYRDPRDVLLSAVDHGNKILAKGEKHSFAEFVEFGAAFQAIKKYMAIWRSYSNLDGILTVKYEDLLENPGGTMKDVQNFLGISLDEKTMDGVLLRYDRSNLQESQRGFLHFNKATSFRYRREMPDEQRERFRLELGALLKEMGYSPD